MKTHAFAIYAAPVALLIMAGGLATPTATAGPDATLQTVQTTFVYDRKAPAAQVYARLKHAAHQLCRTPGPRPIELRKEEDACIDSVMKDGVAQIGRADIAQLHGTARG